MRGVVVADDDIVVVSGMAVDPYDYWYRDSFGRLHHVIDSGDIIIVGPAPVGIYIFEWDWYVGHPYYHHDYWRSHPYRGHDYYRHWRPEHHEPRIVPPQHRQQSPQHQVIPKPRVQPSRPIQRHQLSLPHQAPMRQPVRIAPQRSAPQRMPQFHPAPSFGGNRKHR